MFILWTNLVLIKFMFLLCVFALIALFFVSVFVDVLLFLSR